ncbi:MATE family efflux transporter [Candidatus Dependentiae bacterium]|nr:MATE family efflux transporter [Candidatus Dependentiae bacterium]
MNNTKRGLFASYVDGIRDKSGQSWHSIAAIFWPEFVTALVLFVLPQLIDVRLVAELTSTTMTATVGLSTRLLHFFMKVAEGLAVGIIVICGQANGAGNRHRLGVTINDALWVSVFFGLIFGITLYLTAPFIYSCMATSDAMATMGVAFVRLRAVGVFCTFVFFGAAACMRGLKDTKTPMLIYLIGALVYILADYGLIFGYWGLPALGLQGSAWAGVIQYAIMASLSLLLLYTGRYREQLNLRLRWPTGLSAAIAVIQLSWPVIIDKATIVFAYLWLLKTLQPMGETVVASFCTVNDLEKIAYLPATACAHVVTVLASNEFGAGNWEGIKSCIKKVFFMAAIGVCAILLLLCIDPVYVVHQFDLKGDFTAFAATVFPIISLLVFFDVLQMILAGALRGVSDARSVMITRLLVCFGYFVPVSYIASKLPIESCLVKSILIYALFYVGHALMSAIYIYRFRTDQWRH